MTTAKRTNPIIFAMALMQVLFQASAFTSRHLASFQKVEPFQKSSARPFSSTAAFQSDYASYALTSQRKTGLCMAADDEGPGPLVSIGILLIMILFVGTGLLPLLDGGGRDLSIADSVVTRQDVPGKLENLEIQQDRLSRATIQGKLSAIPVFFISDGTNMGPDIYLSYAEAKEAAGDSSSVKATSLDQVMYPLILKRGRMRMAPPPAEVQKAEEQLNSEDGGPTKTYRLIPSKASRAQAKEFNMDLVGSDVPLFVADRLAFASAKGPQLPLFVNKDDCELSYQRLRTGKSSLPEKPSIRSTTLLDELNSMEKGTRPGVSQLAFYATAEDVQVAAGLIE